MTIPEIHKSNMGSLLAQWLAQSELASCQVITVILLICLKIGLENMIQRFMAVHVVMICLVTPNLPSWIGLLDVFSHQSPHCCTLSHPGLLESIPSLAVTEILMIITTSLEVQVILDPWLSYVTKLRRHVYHHRPLVLMSVKLE